MKDIYLIWFDGNNERTKSFDTVEEAETYRKKYKNGMVCSSIYKKVIE
jgi:hypothetical protein